jgi:phage baseplate assembly protein W
MRHSNNRRLKKLDDMDRSFLGTGWNFPPTFRREWQGVEMLSDEADVQSSLGIILATVTGERVMVPTFGANLQPHVFDTMNIQTTTYIEKIVTDALVYNEPRIIVDSVTCTQQANEGTLSISVDYTIIRTNTRYNYVYPFYLNEATNIVK